MSGSVPDITEHIRLLIVDHCPAVREGLGSMLGPEPDMEVVAEAADGAEALLLIEAVRPDMVLIDIFMPRMGGIEATRAIKARWPETRVLVFSSLETPSLVQRALAAGADGYLVKDAPARLLVSSIRAVAAGDFVMKVELWRTLMRSLLEQA
jgi:DNA-binding NarL/FixJ family response regulator